MKKFLLFLGLTLAMGTNAQTTYFVDDIAGNDRNEGTSLQSAFLTIARINTLALNPGDSLLFRRGGQWTGNLVPKGSGQEKKRIVIGAYGNGPAPVLDAKGDVNAGEIASYTIRLFNQEYFEIRDLKIRNFSAFETPRKLESRGNASYVYAPKMGIYIEGKDCGTLHDIHLVNLEICDINGDMSTKDNGGVFIEITGNEDESKRVPSHFDGLYTEGCYIHHVDRTGWSNTSVWWNRSLHSQWGDSLANGKIHNWFPSENIILRNNIFERAGANALIVRVAAAPLVEHCLFTHNGWKGSGNASFPFNCDDALFQYNEACYTVYNSEADSWDNRKDADAGGFDSDWNCKNTIIQYNYSHNNGYGGILICCDGGSKTGFNDGTIVRYNIFEDNEHHVIRSSGPTTNSKIYNNVIFSGQGLDSVMLVYHKSWGGYSDSTAYMNNIFYSGGVGNHFDLGKSTRNIFTANTFYGNIANEPDDPMKSKLNPLFKNTAESGRDWKKFLNYLLQDESPEIDNGIEITGHPNKDFLGNPVKGKPDRGAFEGGK
jgi:hypothetical protein